MVFFLTHSGFVRELMARAVRGAIGRVVCVISDYSSRVIAEARRVRAMVIADRPSYACELELRAARASNDLAGLEIIDTAGDGVPPYPGAPTEARPVIVVNGEHSHAESAAADMHSRGFSYEKIGEVLAVDAVTARTFVRRATRKNRAHPEIPDVLQQLDVVTRG